MCFPNFYPVYNIFPAASLWRGRISLTASSSFFRRQQRCQVYSHRLFRWFNYRYNMQLWTIIKKSPIFVYGELLPYRFQQKQRPWSSLKKILLHSTICFAVVCLVVKLVLRNGQTGRSLCIRIPNTDPILICVDPYSEKLRNTDPIGIWINDTVLRRTNSRLLPFQRTLTCCHVAVVASPDHYWFFFWFFCGHKNAGPLRIHIFCMLFRIEMLK